MTRPPLAGVVSRAGATTFARVLVALAGGVGAARFLRGLVQVVAPDDITVIVNTGDDDWFHGLLVCPDLDTVTYTLAGAENPETATSPRTWTGASACAGAHRSRRSRWRSHKRGVSSRDCSR